MNAKEFFSLGLKPGDRVSVALRTDTPVEAFFDGYKTFGNHILRYPDYDLFPVFRAVSKNDKMLPQSPWEGHGTGEGFWAITSCRKKRFRRNTHEEVFREHSSCVSEESKKQ